MYAKQALRANIVAAAKSFSLKFIELCNTIAVPKMA